MPIVQITSELSAALAGRYVVEREIGRGGMAVVYLARDTKHDRLVAVKVLHPELGAMPGAERFLAEIRTTATLQHPNLLPLFDSGEAGGLLYYVMGVALAVGNAGGAEDTDRDLGRTPAPTSI